MLVLSNMESGFERINALVIARKRGFWTTGICADYFPKILLMSPNANKLEQFFYACRGLLLIFLRRPKILILGTSTKIVSWYSFLRKIGFLKNLKIITDKQYIPEKEVRYMDKIIVYSPGEIEQYSDDLKNKFIFLHYPSKTELVSVQKNKISGEYIFCGGSNMRDHKSFLEAIGGLPVRAVLVTDKPILSEIPSNCQVFGRLPLDEYISIMAGSSFVVVSLFQSKLPHGHCDISNALSLGKPVITTRGASADDYIEEGENGFFVDAGDVAGYRKAITDLTNDRKLLQEMSSYTKSRIENFSYKTFGQKLFSLCQRMINRF